MSLQENVTNKSTWITYKVRCYKSWIKKKMLSRTEILNNIILFDFAVHQQKYGKNHKMFMTSSLLVNMQLYCKFSDWFFFFFYFVRRWTRRNIWIVSFLDIFCYSGDWLFHCLLQYQCYILINIEHQWLTFSRFPDNENANQIAHINTKQLKSFKKKLLQPMRSELNFQL